jgi:hypothetical protein
MKKLLKTLKKAALIIGTLVGVYFFQALLLLAIRNASDPVFIVSLYTLGCVVSFGIFAWCGMGLLTDFD